MLAPTSEPRIRRRRHIAAAAVAICLCALAYFQTKGRVPAGSHTQATPRLQLDPNSARWEELATLPGLGEHAAKQIVQYRQKQQSQGRIDVFSRAEDLDAVPEIGLRTVEQIRPYLRFSDTLP